MRGSLAPRPRRMLLQSRRISIQCKSQLISHLHHHFHRFRRRRGTRRWLTGGPSAGGLLERRGSLWTKPPMLRDRERRDFRGPALGHAGGDHDHSGGENETGTESLIEVVSGTADRGRLRAPEEANVAVGAKRLKRTLWATRRCSLTKWFHAAPTPSTYAVVSRMDVRCKSWSTSWSWPRLTR